MKYFTRELFAGRLLLMVSPHGDPFVAEVGRDSIHHDGTHGW
jgi:hypothetical protein